MHVGATAVEQVLSDRLVLTHHSSLLTEMMIRIEACNTLRTASADAPANRGPSDEKLSPILVLPRS